MDYKKELTYDEKVLVKTLRWHESNALTQSELAQFTGYTKRQIKYLVNSLRRKHCPVVSGSTGYYLSYLTIDIEKTTKILTSQIRTLLDTRDSLDEIIINPKYIEDLEAFLKED